MKAVANDDVPDWLRAARDKWTHTGLERPPFAIEPGPGQESVWDYPRPPAVVPDSRHVVVGDPTNPVASSRQAVRVLETAGPPTFYLPLAEIDMGRLVEVAGASVCEWKGQARYWALGSDGSTPIGWDYPEPFPEYADLVDHLAFYPGRVLCTVDGEIVQPQPGGFYGGWVTAELVGPFKGEPGTGGW